MSIHTNPLVFVTQGIQCEACNPSSLFAYQKEKKMSYMSRDYVQIQYITTIHTHHYFTCTLKTKAEGILSRIHVYKHHYFTFSGSLSLSLTHTKAKRSAHLIYISCIKHTYFLLHRSTHKQAPTRRACPSARVTSAHWNHQPYPACKHTPKTA